MIEMPISQMIPNIQESSSMDSDVFVTTTVMTTNKSSNETMTEDMIFNAGHQVSIIVYRFVPTTISVDRRSFMSGFVCLHSILMVISAIGNITVLALLIKRRMRTPSRLDIMLTHLAIADLMVSDFLHRIYPIFLFFTPALMLLNLQISKARISNFPPE